MRSWLRQHRQALAAAFGKVAAQKSAATPAPAAADEFGRYLHADYERWRKVVSAAGIKAE